ncbi:RNA 2',3'-cyclic phosphodiesterase [Thiocapsa bogorovii]|uniref:RNA 2',3'-cyclic phosphodiesterase n=1 Tax=Thiocapsa bogorovii TaxID=521689 RepID=UPI001E554E11|nr:RNA 2',3'-cyclic phosphodiesterase [Thiocapsa bogorovii]UHD15965.1 RNA 2',3'-cyclic phosphodiesterase [Thiocapsa bogorovii]
MAERWFFALWPDDAVRDALAARVRELLPVGARAIHPSDFHLTLAFLGPLAPDVLGCAEGVADRIRAPELELELDRVGCFARARVLWCGPACPPETLPALVSDLQVRLATCGLAADPRPYRPHITLARQAAAAPPGSEWSTPIRWSVREIVLAAGYGGPRPRYRVRRRWALH